MTEGEMASEDRNARIVAMYEAGWTQNQIGSEFGITESRVCQILQAHGVSGLARRAEQRAVRQQEVEAERQQRQLAREARDSELTRRWLAGETTATIGVVLGVGPSVVGRRAKALGLPQRCRGGWGSSRATSGPPSRTASVTGLPSVSTEKVARRLKDQRVRGEVERERVLRGRLRCCEQMMVVDCLCGRRCCEDHAVMTSDGPRCRDCMAVA